MKKLSLKDLDDALRLLDETSEESPVDFQLKLKRAFPNISDRNRRAIMDKLIEDKHITSFKPVIDNPTNLEMQFINFNGLMLLENGGYVKKRCRERFSRNLQLALTILICFATVASAIFYYFQLNKMCPCQ